MNTVDIHSAHVIGSVFSKVASQFEDILDLTVSDGQWISNSMLVEQLRSSGMNITVLSDSPKYLVAKNNNGRQNSFITIFFGQPVSVLDKVIIIEHRIEIEPQNSFIPAYKVRYYAKSVEASCSKWMSTMRKPDQELVSQGIFCIDFENMLSNIFLKTAEVNQQYIQQARSCARKPIFKEQEPVINKTKANPLDTQILNTAEYLTSLLQQRLEETIKGDPSVFIPDVVGAIKSLSSDSIKRVREKYNIA